MKMYIVNELCELDCTYNNCYGAFSTKEKALEKAMEVFQQAKSDIKNCEFNDELKVWDDDCVISINIDEVDCPDVVIKSNDYFVLGEEDLEEVLKNNFDEEEINLIYKHFSQEQIIDILRNKIEIDWMEYTEAPLRCRILERARELEQEEK